MGSEPGVFGREEELSSIEAWLAAIERGASQLLIEGDAGIGKTALLRAGIAAARSHNYRVLAAQPTRAERHLSFTGLLDLLEPTLGEVLPVLPEPQREALEVALLRRSMTGRPPDPRTVGAATLGCLRAFSARPLVIAVDDVQWLDAATANALSFAVRRLSSEPVGILLARRGSPGLLASLLDPDAKSLRRLGVVPLQEDAIRELLYSHLAWAPSLPVLRRIVEASGGNPLFALELSRALRDEAEPDPGGPLPVPERLRDLVLSRLRGLPARHRRVLLNAAALRGPTVSLLRLAAQDAAGVDDALEAAEEASFLIRRGEHVSFAHPMFASVLYGAARMSGRRAVHARLADVVSDPEERARHRALATSGPDEEIAAELETAARIARARGATATAADLAELARSRTTSDQGEAAWRRQLLAAQFHMESHDPERAKGLLQSIASDAPVTLRAEALLGLASLELRRAGPTGVIDLLRAAVALLGNETIPLQARLWVQLSFVLATSLQPNRLAIEAADRGMRVARRVGDQATESLAVLASLFAKLLGGLGLDRSMLDLIPPIDSGAPSLFLAGMLLTSSGDFPGARAWLEGLREQQVKLGDEYGHPMTTLFLAELEWREGNHRRSGEFGAETMRLADQGGQLTTAAPGAAYAARSMAAAGDLDKARALIAHWRPAVEQTGLAPAITITGAAAGFVELCAGDAAAAVRALESIWSLTEGLGLGDEAVIPFRADLIEALVRVGDVDRAERLLEIVEGRASAHEAFTRQSWLRCRELVAAARGDLATGLAAGARAIELCETVPMPFEAARTHLVHGTVLRRAKHKRAAGEMLDRAVAGFRSLDATVWADRAAAERERVAVRPRAALELTPTEARIAGLAAEGRTNREIASTLSLSVRTVEDNLTRIYRKLGVTRRAELVRLLARADAP